MKKIQKQSPGGVQSKRILKKSAKFTGTHLYWSIFYQSYRSQLFSCEFCEIFENIYFAKLNNFPNSNLMTSIIFAHKIWSAYTVKILSFIRSSRPEVFRSAILLKKRLQQRCFFVNVAKFLRTLFITEHLLWLLLFYGDVFFSMGRLSSFLNFMKTWAKFTKSTLREV